jgi:predicted phage-related endonuclease
MSLTPEQIAIRRTRIGSSEVGAILGIDPYKSAYDVWTEKMLPPEVTAPSTRRGVSTLSRPSSRTTRARRSTT